LRCLIQNIAKLFLKLLVIPGVTFLFSCENEIEKINLLTSSTDYPDMSGKKVEIIYSDSGKVQVKLAADEIKRFSKVEKPYLEFPKGIDVIFYNDTLGISAHLTADYAIYYTMVKLWEARGNVIVRDLEEGRMLNSEELFWDEDKGKVYSNIFSRIEDKDGTYYGENGFESDQNLKRFKFKNFRGTVNLKDEPVPK
jgi:LPS export ABC transporter protein LptC